MDNKSCQFCVRKLGNVKKSAKNENAKGHNEKIVGNKNRIIATMEHIEIHLKALMCRFCEKLKKRKLSAWLTDSCACVK